MYQHENRPFDAESYKINDPSAKATLKNYLIKRGFHSIEDNENYSFDLTGYKDNKKYLFEVEIKNQWLDVWPNSWQEIRIPKRKERLILEWKKSFPACPFYFVILNHNMNYAWLIDADIVGGAKTGKIKNSTKTNAPHLKEPFYHIDKDKALLIAI